MKHHIISPKQDQGNALILSLKLNGSKSYSSQLCLTPSDLSCHVYLLLEVTIIFSFDRLAVWSKMSAKWREMSISVSKKPITTSSNVLSWQQPKDIEFTVMEEERNQKFVLFFPLKDLKIYINTQNDRSITKTAASQFNSWLNKSISWCSTYHSNIPLLLSTRLYSPHSTGKSKKPG